MNGRLRGIPEILTDTLHSSFHSVGCSKTGFVSQVTYASRNRFAFRHLVRSISGLRLAQITHLSIHLAIAHPEVAKNPGKRNTASWSPPKTHSASPIPVSLRLLPRQSLQETHSAVALDGRASAYLGAYVSASPLGSLWDLKGASPWVIAKRTVKSFLDDNLLGRAAELGFYFLFALFPTLVSASSMLGLAARSASQIYSTLLAYLAVVIPPSAMGIVMDTFNQTTAASTRGKITFGLAAAIWSASVGFSAIQDTLNIVYKVPETRPYWKARGGAILVTILLSVLVTCLLAAMLGGDVLAHLALVKIYHHWLGHIAAFLSRLIGWIVAAILLAFSFSVIYFFAPDLKSSRGTGSLRGPPSASSRGSSRRSVSASISTSSTATPSLTARSERSSSCLRGSTSAA